MSYAAASLVQIPFMNTELYIGPVAKYLNGADIAWIVGLIVAAAVYYFPMRARLSRRA